MTRRMIGGVVGGLCGLVCVVTLTLAGGQDGKGDAMGGDKKDPNQAMMEQYLAASRPGASHRRLDALIGEWTTKTTAWMAPGAPAVETAGHVTKRWELDGRFVREDIESTGPDGRPYKGTGYLGFDNGTKKYQGVWMSDMMTGMITYAGAWDESKKAIVCEGSESNPMDGAVMKTRMETRIDGPDKHTLTYWYIMPGGQEMKAFVIEHARKAPAR